MMKRIAIIGCGVIAKNHALGIQDLGYECVGVTDIFPEAAENFAKNYPQLRADFLQAKEWMTPESRTRLATMFSPPQVYPDVASMLKGGGVDAVIIATLPPSHCELSCLASEMGAKAVLCEKPMALSAAECEQVISVCEHHGTRFVEYADTTVLYPQYHAAKKILDSNEIGEVEFIRMQCSESLMDISVYQWALLDHLFPDRPLKTIQAALEVSSGKFSFGHLQEDSSVVHFTMDGNLSGLLLTGASEVGHWIHIDGSKGSIHFPLSCKPSLKIRTHGNPTWEERIPKSQQMVSDRRDLLKGILEDDPVYRKLDGQSGLKHVLPIFAAWQSHLEQRPVNLSEPITASVPTEQYTACV